MLPANLLPHALVVLTPVSTTDAYGNTRLDYANATSRVISGYARHTGSSARPGGDEYPQPGRNVAITALQVHTNDKTVTATDRVVYDGATYEIDGQPLMWKSAPGGRLSHTKFQLRKVDG